MMSRSQLTRRGLVAVAMLIGLMIVGLVAASLLKVAAGRRTLARTAENERQATALADSGLDRALARLESHPEYAGEVWEIAATDLGGRGAGRVMIEVKSISDRPDQRLVTIVADYLVAVPGPVRDSRKVVTFIPQLAR